MKQLMTVCLATALVGWVPLQVSAQDTGTDRTLCNGKKGGKSTGTKSTGKPPEKIAASAGTTPPKKGKSTRTPTKDHKGGYEKNTVKDKQ